MTIPLHVVVVVVVVVVVDVQKKYIHFRSLFQMYVLLLLMSRRNSFIFRPLFRCT